MKNFFKKEKRNYYKIDLHTHSTLSHDGGLDEEDYRKILNRKILDFIAITDHNEIDFAINLNKKLGEKIIIGEEISTAEGHLIGLFLNKKIQKGLSLESTILEIQRQGGIVYLPHPFDYRRSGVKYDNAEKYLAQIDIIEVFNSRTISLGINSAAAEFAAINNKPKASGTDSHSFFEVGRSYSIISDTPNKENIVKLIEDSSLVKRYVRPWNFFSPKLNKLKKFIG